jgi:ATP-dependent Clp protease ATP-binding subunit ClpC
MFERFTEPAREVVVLGRDEAQSLNLNYIGSEHLLLGLVREEQGVAARVLENAGLSLDRTRAEVVRIARPMDEPPAGQGPFTPAAKKVLELALRETLAFQDNFVGTAHILLGLTNARDDVAERLLAHLGADSKRIAAELLRLRSAPDGTWDAQAWEEPPPGGARPSSKRTDRPLKATAVKAAVEVALVAAAKEAGDDDRWVDLGDLMVALAERWPEDLVARVFADLGVDRDGLRAAVEAARRRRE